MGILQNLNPLNWLGRKDSPKPARRNAHDVFASYSDGFAAGKRDRHSEDWAPSAMTPSGLHRIDADVMRNRARDLMINNPYAKSAVGAYISNVIGRGITPKPTLDNETQRKQWSDAWNYWGGVKISYTNECDMTEQQSIYELMALWLTEVIVGGGCIVRYVTLPDHRRTGRSLPLALELIPEERFANDKDEFIAWRNNKKSSNNIFRGIEIDSATGRPLAFWIKPSFASDSHYQQWEPVRYDARNCRYSFFKNRVGQIRGITLMHAVIMWLWKLGYYVDNELMSSAIKSCFAAAITTENDAFPTLSDSDDGTSPITDVNGNPLEKLEPGIIARLRKGESISGIGPNTPASDTNGWLIMIQRSIAIGMGLSYESVCRDYSQGSFSSVRAGTNEDRVNYEVMQQFVISNFCLPTRQQFVRAAVLEGLEGFPSPAEFSASPMVYLDTTWRVPAKQSVNPWDDVRAAVMEIDNGLGTREEYVAKYKGGDWEETDSQLEREKTSAESKGLHFGAPDEAAMGEPSNNPPDQQNGGKKRAPTS